MPLRSWFSLWFLFESCQVSLVLFGSLHTPTRLTMVIFFLKFAMLVLMALHRRPWRVCSAMDYFRRTWWQCFTFCFIHSNVDFIVIASESNKTLSTNDVIQPVASGIVSTVQYAVRYDGHMLQGSQFYFLSILYPKSTIACRTHVTY